MKNILYILPASLLACSELEQEKEMPIENIKCTHPDSRFEGVVEVEFEDDVMWENIDFEISQGENVWNTALKTEDYYFWSTRMQLYDLDCFGDYNAEIIYGIEI